MQKPAYIPRDYNRIAVVGGAAALISADFGPEANCILWPGGGALSGDFNALGAAAGRTDRPLRLYYPDLKRLRNRAAGAVRAAAETALADMDAVAHTGSLSDIYLKIIPPSGYGDGGTDRFHADGSSLSKGRLLRAYGEATIVLRNDGAAREPGTPFFLPEGEKGRPFSLAPGDMWRQASLGNSAGVPPFIHRAPSSSAGFRALLVADYTG